MGLNFDDEWFIRIERQMRAIRKLIDEPALREAMRRVKSVQSHIEGINRVMLPQLEAVNRTLRAWQEGPAQQMARQYEEMFEQVRRATDPWHGRLPEIMDAAARAAEALHTSWQAAVPSNWRDLAFVEIEAVLDLMEESGWALVWIPRGEIVRTLIETDADAREARLLSVEADVLDDLLFATDGLTRPELTELRDANREAIDSYRDQRLLAAQSLATVVFTTLFHQQIAQTFGGGRTRIEPLDPRDATIANIRLYCVLRVVLVAIVSYSPKDGEPIPNKFNRHASTHRLSAAQYTRLNALAALMLSTALLCEIDKRGALLPSDDV